MGLIDDAKDAAGRLIDSAKNEKAAHDEKSESDITPDPHVAGARKGGDRTGREDEGEYVGRTNPQFDADVQQTGAEARAEAARNSSD